MQNAPANTSDSHLAFDKTSGQLRACVGAPAVDFFRIRCLASSIRLHGKTGMIPTRGVTITRMMVMAGGYTGQKYKTRDHDRAVADLTRLAQERGAALPAVEV